MKKLSVLNRALVSASTVLLAACGSYSSPTAPVTTSTVTPSTIAGNWVVSSLTQRTEDKSSQFSGYTFTFAATGADNGTVTATRNGSTVSGTWSHSAAVTYYGSTSTESLVLQLGTASPFDRLTGTWNVESSTSSSLDLVSPEVAENAHLILTKQ